MQILFTSIYVHLFNVVFISSFKCIQKIFTAYFCLLLDDEGKLCKKKYMDIFTLPFSPHLTLRMMYLLSRSRRLKKTRPWMKEAMNIQPRESKPNGFL